MPTRGAVKSPVARIERLMTVDPETGCWLMVGRKGGYAAIHVTHAPGVYSQPVAHRVMYEHYKGEIPEGYVLDHLCLTKNCVRPDHLEAVTPQVNTLRAPGPTSVNAAKTHCIHGHEFTPENTMPQRSDGSGRRCRACVRIQSTRRRNASK